VAGEVIIFRTDGVISRRVAITGLSPFTSDWAPDGTLLTLDDANNQPLRTIDATGTVRFVN